MNIIVFEKAVGAFGFGTEPPADPRSDKRAFGRWDPLSGDKFIKSKVGRVLHTPIPKTPKINLFKGETVEGILDEYNCELFDEGWEDEES